MTSGSRKILTIAGGLLLFALILALVAYSSGLLGERSAATDPALAGAAGRPGQDPMVGFNYMLACPNGPSGYFTYAAGLGSTSQLVEQKISGPGGVEMKLLLPGPNQFSPLVLVRGLTQDMSLFSWRKTVVDGNIKAARLTCELTMMDSSMTMVAQWRLANVWPMSYIAPADGSEYGIDGAIAIEAITLVYENLERVK